MNAEYDNHFKLEFQPEMSCIFVLEVSNLPLSTIFRLDIGPVPTVCYYYFFHFVLSILMEKYRMPQVQQIKSVSPIITAF